MKVIYSKDALESLREIVDFLDYRWTQKELNTFRKDLEKLVETLQKGTIHFPKIMMDKPLHYALIGKKQVKVYFDLSEDSVEFLLFLPSKANPQKLLNLLQ